VKRGMAADASPHSPDGLAKAKTFLKAGLPVKAADMARSLLQHDPEDVEALYILAVSFRYMQKSHDALDTLRQLKSIEPGYARAYQEEGHNRRELNKLPAAVSAYEQAVALNPALLASWQALCELYVADGDDNAAKRADQQLSHLSNLPRELLSVTSLICQARFKKAEKLCRDFLQKHKHHIEAMRLLAQIGSRLYVLDDAEFLLESCVELDPDNHLARYDYVNVLQKRHKFRKALQQAQILRTGHPGRPAFELTFANASLAVGDIETALSIYDAELAQSPRSAHTHIVRGHALKSVGRTDAAVASYKAACVIDPKLGESYWSLANLKTYKFSTAELDQMKRSEAEAGLSLENRYRLCFSLGKGFEDREEFETSFAYYERANALKLADTRYSADRIDAEIDAQIASCTDQLFADNLGSGNTAPDPIFIVGLPRAGSTLLEQIIASHPLVDGTLELPNILALAHRLNGRRRAPGGSAYPRILAELTPAQLKRFGEDYIDDTRIYRKGAPFFIDKMPNNFRHIGLIHLMLPNAKIIDARRHPMACCFGAYKQLFAEGQEFSYGLEPLGRYYKKYVELMFHWDSVLPGKIFRVQYEDVVADLDAQVRNLLDFCGLPFEQSCVDFYETERAVRTPSSEQVRQPIYKSGLDQWRNYRDWLGPLSVALGQAHKA
jgi:tetratricopeptide (TPR) repeat protein